MNGDDFPMAVSDNLSDFTNLARYFLFFRKPHFNDVAATGIAKSLANAQRAYPGASLKRTTVESCREDRLDSDSGSV